MRAFVCEIDTLGLRRVLPEHILPAEELSRLARASGRRSTALVWALLDEPDAEALRHEVGSGRNRDACGLLLNRAVELLPIAAALPMRPT
ncbi:MAG: hypothetical protein U0790_28275 [Isosphaeraceae bacterium]